MENTGKLRPYSSILMACFRAGDLVSVTLSGWLSFWLLHGRVPADDVMTALILTILLVMITFPAFHLYDGWRGQSIAADLDRLLAAWLLVLAGLMVIALVTKTTSDFSRLWMGVWSLAGFMLLTALRLALRVSQRWLRAKGYNTRSVVIIGTGELAQCTANQLLQQPWAGFRVVGFFDDDPLPLTKLTEPRPLLGGIADLSAYLQQRQVEQVWIAIPWSCKEAIIKALNVVSNGTKDIRIVPDLFSYDLLSATHTVILGMPVLNWSVSPIEGMNGILKGILDRGLALMILVIISPLLAAIALGIKLSSPGPVLFRQLRYGLDGQSVEVWKFRTMTVHQEEEGQVTQATRSDPRVTRFGAFLRRTSLDELPQFMNVLQGRMSIVGPRPHAVAHNEYYRALIERYMLRHKVKPGITGWAQVNGYRGETDTLDKMQRRVECDLDYIEHWSLWLDVKIILLTIVKGFYSKNAY